MLVPIVVGVATALVTAWLIGTIIVILALPRGQGARSVAAFFPNVLRLLRDLYRDPAVPPSARRRVWIAVIYNIQPFTLIPDFLPVIGFADNLVVTIWALRSAVHKAGAEPVVRHWRGTPEQLALLFRVARLDATTIEHGHVGE